VRGVGAQFLSKALRAGSSRCGPSVAEPPSAQARRAVAGLQPRGVALGAVASAGAPVLRRPRRPQQGDARKPIRRHGRWRPVRPCAQSQAGVTRRRGRQWLVSPRRARRPRCRSRPRWRQRTRRSASSSGAAPRPRPWGCPRPSAWLDVRPPYLSRTPARKELRYVCAAGSCPLQECQAVAQTDHNSEEKRARMTAGRDSSAELRRGTGKPSLGSLDTIPSPEEKPQRTQSAQRTQRRESDTSLRKPTGFLRLTLTSAASASFAAQIFLSTTPTLPSSLPGFLFFLPLLLFFRRELRLVVFPALLDSLGHCASFRAREYAQARAGVTPEARARPRRACGQRHRGTVLDMRRSVQRRENGWAGTGHALR
jgi:hypothetical protein